ncbi:hypothetical protein MnTg02_00034 [bacterium MnTg02]|nr:hypothetical protein MnTg02_00034 [bacterium MnTg02]
MADGGNLLKLWTFVVWISAISQLIFAAQAVRSVKLRPTALGLLSINSLSQLNESYRVQNNTWLLKNATLRLVSVYLLGGFVYELHC